MNDSDKSLVKMARAADRSALAALTRKYQDDVFTMVHAQVISMNLAVTIAEEVFVEAFMKLHRLTNGHRFDICLYKMALEVLTGHNNLISTQVPECPEDVLRMRIRALPVRTRAVLILHDVLRLPENDVATVLGTDRGELRRLLQHGRRALIESEDLESVQAA